MINKHRAYPYLLQYLSKIKSEIRRRIFLKNSFDLRELFDHDNFELSDIYEHVVFRSTKKENYTEPHEGSTDPVFLCDLFDNMLPKDANGEIALSSDEFGDKLSSEFENVGDDLFILYRDIGYFYDEYQYAISAKEIEISKEYEDNRIEKSVERLLKFQNEPLSSGKFKYDVSDNDKGYIAPVYNLLRWNIDHINKEQEYEKISKEFNIYEEPTINVAVSVGNYRDLLAKQLDRQIEQLVDINDTLLDFLNIFYVSIEWNLRKVFVSNDSEGLKHAYSVADDWLYIIGMMREIFDTFILNNNGEEILKYHEKTISEIPYAHKQVKDDLIRQMYHIDKKKRPILKVARKLALKVSICESLLEDFLMGEPIKTFTEFSQSLKITPTREDIIKKAFALQINGMKWSEVMEEIRDWLFEDHGLDEDSVKRKYDIGLYDYVAFSRVMNKNKIHPE